VRLCHDDWGVTSEYSLNLVMAYAAAGGQEAIVRLCHDEWGATSEYAVNWAAHNGQEAIVGCATTGGAPEK
jgi:hypothetical protein